ncbi:helix-turn-helix transcriptional regulator [Allobranchiibius sp. CTAmp26]|uniref:helix-turn-helix transcriptional regulator n=1 Tax=Allobranchiibius sp. CTAmp26 TaxID=2815214 RepID=UPI001FB62B80|nr:helix-turn-helix transcriptional regulator [Allobranchiibius sp. CTAmp26]
MERVQPMARIGPTTTAHAQRWAGNMVKAARARTGLTQRDVAAAAGVPASTIAQIESGRRQPSFPLLFRILVEGTGLEPRTRLEPFDDHDTVLDALVVTDPAGTATAREAQQSFERAAGLG